MDLINTKLSAHYIDQIPGFLLWKNMDSVYLGGNHNTAMIKGFKQSSQLVGMTDHTIQCDARDYANDFIKQDKAVFSANKPLSYFDIHPYVNGEIRLLLIEKSPFKNTDGKVEGIICHCTEITNNVLLNISQCLMNQNILKNVQSIPHFQSYLVKNNYKDYRFSEREEQCLFYLLRGKSAREIGELLCLSKRTVEGYQNNLKNKMQCDSLSEVIEKSINHGYLSVIPRALFNLS